MPELPEVEMFRRYFDQTSLNQKINDVIIQHPKVVSGFEEDLTKLVGDQFASTLRWGKTMLIRTTSNNTIFMHFGMTGNLQYYNSSLEMPKYSRVVFEFDSGFNLGYVSKRMFGRLGLTESPDSYVKQKALGADALEIPEADFIESISGKNKNIKAALLDQSVTAGVGNWIADEILYQAKILPESRCRDLNGEQLAIVFREMQLPLMLML